MSTIARDIAAAAEHTLQEEARRHELALAVITACGMTLMSLVAAVYVFFVLARTEFARPWWAAYYVGATVLTWAFAMLLRRGWYRRWLAAVVPVCFVILLVLPGLEISRAFVVAQGVGAVGTVFPIGALCAAIVLVTGSFRHRVSAVVMSSIAALGLMLWTCFLTGADVLSAIVCSALLVPLALLTGWLSAATRKLVRSQAARITLGRFLPDGVVAGAWDDAEAAFARPRLIDATVLVTDLRGFTSWAETRAPDEVLGFLNEVQGAFADVVRAEGGTVDKFLGDGMLAVFGVTGAPDHAAAALSASRKILAVAAVIAARRHEPVKVGIGVHSGPVVVGCLGSAARLEFTVLGDTVNTASRLESLPKEHKVTTLVSEETARRAGATLPAIGTVDIRGRQAPLSLFSLPADP